MSEDASTPGSSEPLHSPEPALGGETIDEAVENAERGTQAEDTGHTPSGSEESGESRIEQMDDVVETSDDIDGNDQPPK